jgi:transposase-like protein
VQILHRFAGWVQQYFEEIADPDRYRPDHCPHSEASQPLTAHGFYSRTVVDVAFDGSIRVRRYLCHACRRTVSLLPEFALPYIRFGITVISLFLIARLLIGQTLASAAIAARLSVMPYQRGQFWIRCFRNQAGRLCAALATLTAPPPAPDFVTRALQMLECLGWITAHRFLFFRSAGASTGLACISRPGRSSCRAPPGGAARLTSATQLLRGTRDALSFMLLPREILPMDAKAEKIALFRKGPLAVFLGAR